VKGGNIRLARAFISISGLVQGIGFRPFVYRIAVRYGLGGYVKNLGDAGVEIVVEGENASIEAFLVDLYEKRPPIAVYTKVDVDWLEENVEYSEFNIDLSDLGKRTVKLSIIPPDITVCPDCLGEMFDPGNRHSLYPFTCCAICGPRFTTIKDLPYDRERTTMEMFPLCPDCNGEYWDPLDRRFNAQTICCPTCGPQMTLYTTDGAIVEGAPLIIAARLLDEGSILAIKGIGGIHLAVKTTDDDSILKMRERRRKPGKPFALMSKTLEAVEGFANVGETERELLTSYARPIVALKKRAPFPLSEYISPGLHTVGVMLPYSGIHQILFHNISEPALVMTSANYPGEPMFTNNNLAFKKLRGIVDYLLLHDRVIHARCDDSVARMVDGAPLFLRRSRGYVPMPLDLSFASEMTVISVGPELTSTAALLKMNRCYLTQHLGNIESPESVEFLEEAIRHLVKVLRGGRADAVACDLHPRFLSRGVAEKLVEDDDAQLVEVQHHHAHLASVMADNDLEPGDEAVGIICDGYGYGSDGEAWGGEILVGGYDDFRRAGHVERQPMPGGDLASVRYGRMLQGILYGSMPDEALRCLLIKNYLDGYGQGEKEVDIVFSQLEKRIYTPWTTSVGRLLDAVSCLLGISYSRTYEGEGAMKLEAFATRGRSKNVSLPVEIEEKGGQQVLKTTQMVKGVLDLIDKTPRTDLAFGFQAALSEGLAEMAIRTAQTEGINTVAFSGGVANNHMITETIRRIVEDQGLRFLRHRRVPGGDGGVSLGQAVVAALREL
jgi:hydrogenase maturation protein HypF